MGWRKEIGALLAGCFCVLALTVGCSNFSEPNPEPTTCTEGQTRACVCPDSGLSSQAVCDALFGFFGPCACGDMSPDAMQDSLSDGAGGTQPGSGLSVQIVSGGSARQSTNYRLNLIIGPAQPVGEVSSPNYRLQLNVLR